MSESNVDVMGSEGTTGAEVSAPVESNQQETPNSGVESNVPESIPYERFSKINSEKNEYKKMYEDQLNLTSQLTQNVNSYLEQNTQEPSNVPNIETIDDVTKYIQQEVENRVKPIEEQRVAEVYKNNVENFFNTNKDASEIRTQIDDYFDKAPDYEKKYIVEAVTNGHVSVLNDLKNKVALQHNQIIKNMASESVANESKSTMTPTSNKIVRDQQPGMSDLIKSGKENSNFSNFFSAFVQEQGLG